MKTAILASEHYFSQRSNSPSALWFNLDNPIKTPEAYKAWLEFAVPLFRDNDITKIFGLTDLTALVAAHCEFLLGSRTKESFYAVINCLNKPQVRKVIGDTAYNVKTITGFPAFVKPVHSSLSQGSGLILSEEELNAHLLKHTADVYRTTQKYRVFGEVAGINLMETFHEFYGEECISEGTQLTVDAVIDNGEISILSVSESAFHDGVSSFDFFDFPYNCPPDAMQEIHEASKDIASKLGLDNLLFNIEFIWTHDGQLKLIEVNPRPATQFIPAIKEVTGFDGWGYLETGDVKFSDPSTTRMAIKILRTLEDAMIDYVPCEQVLAVLHREMNGKYNSFVDTGSMLSEYQQDGVSYRVGEIYLPYADVKDRKETFQKAIAILQMNYPLITAGQII